MFVHGEQYEHDFDTDLGPVGILADASIIGDRLILSDISVYPRETSEILPIGPSGVRRIFGQLKSLAKSQGFVHLTITGERLTGRNPGRTIKRARNL
jgi:hypothetical protein